MELHIAPNQLLMVVKLLAGFILLLAITIVASSCSPVKHYSSNYYFQHQPTINSVQQSYKSLYSQCRFAVAFTDKQFLILNLEIYTGPLTYSYQFNTSELRLKDTLTKYHLDTNEFMLLIKRMRSIRCIWISNLDYYVNDNRQSLVLISLKPIASNPLFAEKEYYVLSFFSKPQYFDAQERLLLKPFTNEIHKINGNIFKKVNDTVGYSISERYR